MQDERATGLLDAAENRFLIQWRQGAQIDHFYVQSLFLQLFRGVERRQNLRPESNDRKIAAIAPGPRFTNLDNVIVLGKLFAQARQAIKFLVLEVKHRIRIANRRLDQTLR